ncbi:MAG: ABC transporter ATP-binding protein [Clostridia bacterium]|nr:ABC transporter ATP-binding protein [Clostridia bacterium]
MIKVRGLTHAFGKKTVLYNINLDVPDGTILGIVGINGAGKSTFLRLLCGVYAIECGDVTFDGRSPSDAMTRKDIFYLPDDPYYTSSTTPNKLFESYKVFYPNIDRGIFEELISKYSINPKGFVKNFSKGMKRQMFIALALAVKPKYLLLDEAFDGLDPLSRKIFKEAIISLVEEENSTVLISSHSLRELEDFCDRFVLIDATVIKSEGDISEHVNKLCKFELAFFEPITDEAFSSLPVVSIENNGRFVRVVLEGNSEEMKAKLLLLSPAVIEEMKLDFEEVFIHDVEKKEGK